MNSQRKIVYETLNRNYTYGTLVLNIWNDEQEKNTNENDKNSSCEEKKSLSSKIKDSLCVFNFARRPLVEDEEKVLTEREIRQSASQARMIKAYAFATIICLMLTNLCCVVVNHMIMNTKMELADLQHQEMQLMNSTNELKISVEELKGPERIREIAMNKLGMLVARENVYVYAAEREKTIGEIYAGAAEYSKDGILAMVQK